MPMKFIRIRVPEDIFKRFCMHCIKRDVSIPKQMTELLRKYVEIQDQNDRLLGQ